MADTPEDMMRLQIRLYRADDPRLFAELESLSTKRRHRRVRQLMHDAFHGIGGVPASAHVETSRPSLTIVGKAKGDVATPAQTDFAATSLTSLPAGFVPPKTLRSSPK